MSSKLLLSAALVIGILAAGCGKKESDQQAAGDFSGLPEVETEAGARSDSVSDDIFDEFYSDEQGVAETEPAMTSEDYGATESYETAYTPSFSEGGPYVVQVSCVRSMAIAEAVKAKLEGMGWPAYIAEVSNPTPELLGTYYRLRIGAFDGVSLAKAFGENALMPAGYEYWVDNKSNDNVGMEGYGLGEAPADNPYETSSETAPAAAEGAWSSEPAPAATEGTSDWSEPASSEPSTDWGSTPATESADDWNTTPAPAAEEAPATDDWGSEPAPEATAPAGTSTGEEPAPAAEPETAPADDWGSGGDAW